MTKFIGLRVKIYSYLIDVGKGTRRCIIKRKYKFKNHKNCLQETQLDNEIIQKKIKLTQILLKKLKQ